MGSGTAWNVPTTPWEKFARLFAMLALGRVSEEREWGRHRTAAHGINERLCRRCVICHDPSGAAVK